MDKERYYNDEELADLYSGYSVVNIDWNLSGDSGWVDLEREGAVITENFIVRTDGKLAFDKWFPEAEYIKLCNIILESKPK